MVRLITAHAEHGVLMYKMNSVYEILHSKPVSIALSRLHLFSGIRALSTMAEPAIALAEYEVLLFTESIASKML